ncbi:DUF434 domain-containing protein [Anaeromicropila herbilytica]|uniref:DUF434 domain-containing protein n=1 Tax=Anaeromicropila herbilytica TaxID=2785025 RepID=A0A7R7IC89_9FIRM|nr:DUF434 domain-containing protein [Anaeromicropila herbilytica]BCN30337.1 hypothetical protein bsdtb5_16320 [Anaeromicropila herbilytica]
MTTSRNRGASPNDSKEFGEIALEKLSRAGCDIYYLLNQGYHIKGATEYVGNHYLLSTRQRMALTRSISSQSDIISRTSKQVQGGLEDATVNIDGFNTIITLEVALCGSLLLKGLDGAIRDLAGLRGNYRIIDKTELAIDLIGEMLNSQKVKNAIFYIDEPISNSGRLRELILCRLRQYGFDSEVQILHNVDSVLEKLEYVITSDAIILDRCISWINLNDMIISEKLDDYRNNKNYVDFGKLIK